MGNPRMQGDFLSLKPPQTLVDSPNEPSKGSPEMGNKEGTNHTQLHQQLFNLNIGSGILDEADLKDLDDEPAERRESHTRGMSFLKDCPVKFPPSRAPSIRAKKTPAGVLGSPPKINSSVLPGAFFSQSNTLGSECPLDLLPLPAADKYAGSSAAGKLGRTAIAGTIALTLRIARTSGIAQ